MAHRFTIKDLVLIAGGLFLLFKGTTEIHDSIEEEGGEETRLNRAGRSRGLSSAVMCFKSDSSTSSFPSTP